MKRIIFMRHGKAEAHNTGLPDYERSLTAKGKSLSHLMAGKLKEKINNPGLLISSPAFRALETALIFALEYDIKPESILLRSDLYFRFNEKTMLQILKSDAMHTDSVVFFGHDPSFTNLANYLSREIVGDVPKSGIVCLSFDIKQWDEAVKGSGIPELIFVP
ncbi:MAG: hypothetical protein GYA43_04355 [Bacteroidales bacterium]|nr:hypothetical protein [Bacteroidales bacterium]